MSTKYPQGIITPTPPFKSTTAQNFSGVWTLEQIANNYFYYKQGVQKSLRFRASATAYLNRTPSTGGNRTTWTFSAWIKRGALGGAYSFFGGWDNSTGATDVGTAIRFNADALDVFDYTNATYNFQLLTTPVFRDPSSWYHVVVAFDTTQATAANRVKIYVNGSQITSFSTATYPNQNTSWRINSTATQSVGCMGVDNAASQFFDGYMAEVNFIDGQALGPSYFGQISPITGVWSPAQYVGSYGTNGFYLPFTNTTSTTTLCADASGNGNNWTPNNISLTAGATYDSMLDSPTSYDNGGNGVGNYAVLNPLNRSGSTFSAVAGNLNWTGSTANVDRIYGTVGMATGKWYWEVTMSGSSAGTYYFFIGVSRATTSISSTYDGTTLAYIGGSDATISGKSQNRNTSVNATYGASWTFGDVIGVALDMDNGTLVFYKNGVSQGTAFSSINSTYPGTYFPITYSDGGTSGTFTYGYNFGQRPFAYTPPSGFKALNTQNLSQPTIANGANYMAATLYTGTGATQSIINAANSVSFQPDFVWTKSRSAAESNRLFDSVRGAQKVLYTNNTNAEGTETTSLLSFNSGGFSLGSGAPNTSAITYVAWQWKANGTAVTNTAGSITSQVSANTTSGFAVVTYTGNGSAGATFGHGLGVAPSMVIVKGRSNASSNWFVYHNTLGVNGYLVLNDTSASGSTSTLWNSTAPSSTVVTLGTNYGSNYPGTMVAYCFAAISGYSAFGSYTGNGSADGPFIYTGFRPRYVIFKPSSAIGEWRIYDTSRNTYNAANSQLYADLSNAEGTNAAYAIDILSNGIKFRGNGDPNASGVTYIYAAFAENPFKYSLAR